MGVIFLNTNNNNIDMANLMNIISKMNKDELEASIAKANKILRSGKAQDIIDNINKNK